MEIPGVLFPFVEELSSIIILLSLLSFLILSWLACLCSSLLLYFVSFVLLSFYILVFLPSSFQFLFLDLVIGCLFSCFCCCYVYSFFHKICCSCFFFGSYLVICYSYSFFCFGLDWLLFLLLIIRFRSGQLLAVKAFVLVYVSNSSMNAFFQCIQNIFLFLVSSGIRVLYDVSVCSNIDIVVFFFYYGCFYF